MEYIQVMRFTPALALLTISSYNNNQEANTMQPIKQGVLSTIDKLLEDVNMDEIMYRLYVLEKIRKGQQAIEDGEIIIKLTLIDLE